MMVYSLKYCKMARLISILVQCFCIQMHVEKNEVANRIEAAWGSFQKHRRWLTNRHLPIKLRLKLFDSVMTPTALFSLATLPMISSIIP